MRTVVLFVVSADPPEEPEEGFQRVVELPNASLEPSRGVLRKPTLPSSSDQEAPNASEAKPRRGTDEGAVGIQKKLQRQFALQKELVLLLGERAAEPTAYYEETNDARTLEQMMEELVTVHRHMMEAYQDLVPCASC